MSAITLERLTVIRKAVEATKDGNESVEIKAGTCAMIVEDLLDHIDAQAARITALESDRDHARAWAMWWRARHTARSHGNAVPAAPRDPASDDWQGARQGDPERNRADRLLERLPVITDPAMCEALSALDPGERTGAGGEG